MSAALIRPPLGSLLAIALSAVVVTSACGSAATAPAGSTAPSSTNAKPAESAAAAKPEGSTSAAAKPAGSTAAAAKPATLVKVGLNSGTAPTGWPYNVAVSRGFFAQQGLTTQGTPLSSDATQIQALVAGDVNFTISGFTVFTAVAGGAKVKFIASAQETPNFQLLVGKDIKSYSDLKGKTLAAGVTGSFFEVLLRGMLAANGLKPGDYQVISMASSNTRYAALKSGQIAGTLLSIPEENLAIKDGFSSLGYVSSVFKDMQYNGYVTSDTWASANPDTVVAFLRALRNATDWLFDPANKAAAIQIYGDVSKLSQDDLEAAYNEMITQHMLSRDLRPNLRGIDAYIDLATSLGAVDKSQIPPKDAWLDLSYVDKLSK